jgi:hypothetical protein
LKGRDFSRAVASFKMNPALAAGEWFLEIDLMRQAVNKQV